MILLVGFLAGVIFTVGFAVLITVTDQARTRCGVKCLICDRLVDPSDINPALGMCPKCEKEIFQDDEVTR